MFFLFFFTLQAFAIYQDTLEKEAREGIHKAIYSLLSWVLEQRRSTIQVFWSNLSKDYNQDSYPKLKTLLSNLQSSTSRSMAELCTLEQLYRPLTRPKYIYFYGWVMDLFL